MKFEVKWKRTVTQNVYAEVEARDAEEALKLAKAGRDGVEVYDTIECDILDESHWKVVKDSQ